MDLKLGEAFKNGVLAKHVKMSAEASKVFLKNKVDEENLDIRFWCKVGSFNNF